MSASKAVAVHPARGTIFDARGNVVRAAEDPRVQRARAFFGGYFGGSYTGARSDRRAMADWFPSARSADGDIVGDLTLLRSRSRDLCRNTPLAAGAVNTVVTNVVGSGLRPQIRVDRELLRDALGATATSDEQLDRFERRAMQLFRYHAERRFFDVAGILTFAQQQLQVARGMLESGDVAIIRRRKPRAGALVAHCWQLVEADRLANPMGTPDRPGFVAGVESDADGAPRAYWFASRHPGDVYGTPLEWTRVAAVGASSGVPLLLLPAWRRRPEQTRGVPYLATVIETLKQLARYGDSELMAAVIGSLFTVFIKSEGGDLLGAGTSPGTDSAGKALPPNYALGEGAILNLLPNESIEIANPGRPNAQYNPFVRAKLEEIGAALELPFEYLVKRFDASYSASRASRLEAWGFFYGVRQLLAEDFCQPTYESVITEAIAVGALEAPGFFEDPLVRAAWLGCEWIGDAPGHIDEESEVAAAKARVDAGFSTREEETAQLTGGSWERNHQQLKKEHDMRVRDGLELPAGVRPAQAAVELSPADGGTGQPGGPTAPAAPTAPPVPTRAARNDARDQSERAAPGGTHAA